MSDCLSRYPIDFDALEKGTWLETELLEEALGVGPSDGARWSFSLVSLCAQIKRECGMLARVSQERIRIMDDQEADEYTYRATELGVRKLARYAQARSLIDRGKLDPEARALAERRDRVSMGVALSATSELRKQRRIEKLVHQPTPELTEPDED